MTDDQILDLFREVTYAIDHGDTSSLGAKIEEIRAEIQDGLDEDLEHRRRASIDGEFGPGAYEKWKAEKDKKEKE